MKNNHLACGPIDAGEGSYLAEITTSYTSLGQNGIVSGADKCRKISHLKIGLHSLGRVN